MDPVAQSLYRAMQARAGGQPPQEKHPLPFIMEQAVALALGAMLVLSQAREHFLAALGTLRSDELEAVRSLAQGLSIESLERVLFYLMESSFVGLLRDKARDEGAKVSVRSVTARRSPVPAVDALAGLKLSRIRKVQIWTQDPTRPDMLLFKTKNAQQLSALMQVLQLEEPLVAAIRALWDKAPLRHDFIVVIDLAQVARTTQNIKAKLTELLSKYGVLQQQIAAPVPPGAVAADGIASGG
jgi:hypothetical protein